MNKRPSSAETSNCPLIPIIALVSDESKVNDAREALTGVGGVNKILHLNSPTKDVLVAIMDVVYNRKKVEDTFRSMKKVRVISSKYPFLPVFGVKASPSKSKDKDYEPTKSSSTSLTGADFKLEEIEDVSDCQSLLPEFLSPAKRTHLPFLKSRDLAPPEEIVIDSKSRMENDDSGLEISAENYRGDVLEESSVSGDKLDIPIPSIMYVTV